MADSFTDHRGTIEDLLITPLDGVTRIFTKAGKVRGNHVHKRTIQWTYVTDGLLLMRTGEPAPSEITAGPGDLVREAPGVPHAWKALEDTICLVFTRGPRTGDSYEQDTERLDRPLLS